ncbi:MAG: MOSC N-terminal beta barrel domain-containing protein [Pirellulales bacterium]
MPQLSRITIYPIKSLDGVTFPAVELIGSGALRNDRRFAVCSPDGKFVNGKRFAAIHRLRAQFTPDLANVTLAVDDGPATTFQLAEGDADLEAWLSDYFQMPVHVKENLETGFPDDLDSPGPTLIGTATLEAVCRWFPTIDLEEARRRFRTNLEIASSSASDECPAFWEDRLFCEDAAPESRNAAVSRRCGDA